jgi:hypothetical protein
MDDADIWRRALSTACLQLTVFFLGTTSYSVRTVWPDGAGAIKIPHSAFSVRGDQELGKDAVQTTREDPVCWTACFLSGVPVYRTHSYGRCRHGTGGRAGDGGEKNQKRNESDLKRK